jgi:hypothetical protein
VSGLTSSFHRCFFLIFQQSVQDLIPRQHNVLGVTSLRFSFSGTNNFIYPMIPFLYPTIHFPYPVLLSYSHFSDFLDDWMTQGTGRCARFCRALLPGASVTHFHSDIGWWDGNNAESFPWSYQSALEVLTLTEVPGQRAAPPVDPAVIPDDNEISSSGIIVPEVIDVSP